MFGAEIDGGGAGDGGVEADEAIGAVGATADFGDGVVAVNHVWASDRAVGGGGADGVSDGAVAFVGGDKRNTGEATLRDGARVGDFVAGLSEADFALDERVGKRSAGEVDSAAVVAGVSGSGEQVSGWGVGLLDGVSAFGKSSGGTSAVGTDSDGGIRVSTTVSGVVNAILGADNSGGANGEARRVLGIDFFDFDVAGGDTFVV